MIKKLEDLNFNFFGYLWWMLGWSIALCDMPGWHSLWGGTLTYLAIVFRGLKK